jgi:hypothetical protein
MTATMPERWSAERLSGFLISGGQIRFNKLFFRVAFGSLFSYIFSRLLDKENPLRGNLRHSIWIRLLKKLWRYRPMPKPLWLNDSYIAWTTENFPTLMRPG